MQPLEVLSDAVSRHGLWLGLPFVFLGGLALNLTPCVYPMIPVTLAFFGGQAGKGVRRPVLLACCYVLGISLNYALLGAMAAMTGALFGSWLQQPAVLVGVALVVVALALSMFGLYDLRLPPWLADRLGRASAGCWGAFAMGLVVGLVAAPCIGPFVLGLLLVVSRLADPVAGFLLFFALGLGMGFPYVVLGLAADRIGRLPRAGSWLSWSKKVLGVILLGLALFFLKPIVPGSLLRWLVVALLVWAGVYLGWLERSDSRSGRFLAVRRLVGAGLVLAGMAGAWPATRPTAAVAWVPYTRAALEQARQEGRPVVIDVYADWCLPCVEMDHVTFRHPRVVEALAPVATLRVDATREVSEDASVLLERHQIYGAPTILFIDRRGEEQRDLRLMGFAGPEEFLERLAQLQ